MKKLKPEFRKMLLWIIGQPNYKAGQEMLERARNKFTRAIRGSKEANQLELVINLGRDFWHGKNKKKGRK